MDESSADDSPRKASRPLAPVIKIWSALIFGVGGMMLAFWAWRLGVLAAAMIRSGLSPNEAEAWQWMKNGPNMDALLTFPAILAALLVMPMLASLPGPRRTYEGLQELIANRPILTMFAAAFVLAIIVFAPSFGLAASVGIGVAFILGRLPGLFKGFLWTGFVLFVVVGVTGVLIGALTAWNPKQITCASGEAVATTSGEMIACERMTPAGWSWAFVETASSLRLLRKSDLAGSPVVIRFYNYDYDR